MVTKKPYGWIFDKQGNRKQINAPVTVNTVETVTGNSIDGFELTPITQLIPVRKPKKILTGKIPDSVGYPHMI